MIIKLTVDNEDIARQILAVQIPSYQVEAEIIGFGGIPQLNDTVETIMSANETFIGFFEEDRLCGFISYTEEFDFIDISRLVVHPDHFRKGIANKLVGYLINGIVKNKKAVVSTGSKNVPAKNLYQRFGFQEIKDIEVAPAIFITLLVRKH